MKYCGDITESVATGEKSNELPKPQDGGWGWVVVFSAFMIHVIVAGLLYTFSIFNEQFIEEFKESKAKTSFVSSVMFGACDLVGPVAGWMTNNFGCRIVAMSGALLAFFGLSISVFARDVMFLIFTAGLCTGIGFGLMILPSVVCIAFYFEKHTALATGIAVSGAGIGNFILAPFIWWMIDLMGWRSCMLIVAGLVLNCLVLGCFFRPLEETDRKRRKSSTNLTNPEDDSAQRSHFSLLQNVPFVIFVCSTYCTSFGLFVPYVFFEERGIDIGIGNAEKISYLLSVVGATNAVARLLFGFLSDLVGIKTLRLYSTAITLCALATIMNCFCVTYKLMAVFAVVFGTTSGVFLSLIPVIVKDLAGLDNMATALGLTYMMVGAGAFIGPPVTGWLYDCFGSYDPGYDLSGAAIAMSSIMLVFIPCSQRMQNLRCESKEPMQTIEVTKC